MLDDLADDDPLFARVRAARPTAPAALERDVIAKLARPSRRPVIVGAVVAIAAIVCMVLLMRGDDDERQVTAIADAALPPVPVDAVERPAAPADAPAPRRHDPKLSAVWEAIERRRDAFLACGAFSSLVIRVESTKGGGHVSLPFAAANRCRQQVIDKLDFPDIPMELHSIDFVLSPKPVPIPDEWKEPIATIERAFATQNLAACGDGYSSVFVIERTQNANPKISVPARLNNFPKDGGTAQVACMTKLFPAMALPPLPPHIRSITVQL